MNRNASALWKGNLLEGQGTLTTESGVLSKTQYSFRTRFAEGRGTNPDELIAASLGGCFSMALSNELGLCGFHPQRIETIATATLEDLVGGGTITHIQLDVRANVPDASQAGFMDAAIAAKINCPISRLLKTNISMTALLDREHQAAFERFKQTIMEQTITQNGALFAVQHRPAKQNYSQHHHRQIASPNKTNSTLRTSVGE